jgi:hypothetical protein
VQAAGAGANRPHRQEADRAGRRAQPCRGVSHSRSTACLTRKAPASATVAAPNQIKPRTVSNSSMRVLQSVAEEAVSGGRHEVGWCRRGRISRFLCDWLSLRRSTDAAGACDTLANLPGGGSGWSGGRAPKFRLDRSRLSTRASCRAQRRRPHQPCDAIAQKNRDGPSVP